MRVDGQYLPRLDLHQPLYCGLYELTCILRDCLPLIHTAEDQEKTT